MKIADNDDHLFTIGEDGLLVVYEVFDKEGKENFDLCIPLCLSTKQKGERRIGSGICRGLFDKQG